MRTCSNARDQTNDGTSWLTVSDAVIQCTERGLPSTPKTIRKWAARSQLFPDNADISARREDTENGFRWSIEAESLDRKIDEELEFEARKPGEPVYTGAYISERLLLTQTETYLLFFCCKPAKRFLRKLVKRFGLPRVFVTDELRSYGAAKRQLIPNVEHRQHKGLNNMTEVSRSLTRRREKIFRRFKSPRHA